MATALAKKAPALAKTKPGKAAPAKTKAKAAPKPKADPKWVAEGQVVEFLGYSNETESPTYEAGARLVIVGLEKNADNITVLNTVPEDQYEAYQEDPESEDVTGDQVLVSEVKKAEKLAEDPYKFEVIHVGKMDELLAEANNDPLAAFTTLTGSIQEAFFYQGGLATELYANRKFQEYGDFEDETDGDKVKYGTGWDKFAREQLNMDGRKALGAIKVYRRFSALPGFDPDTIASLGWVKLDIMANSVTEDNVAELIDRAESTSTQEFREVIRTEYVADRESQGTARQSAAKIKKVAFNFKLYEDAGEGVKVVFDEAKKSTGITDENQLLERIVMEWARDHLTESVFSRANSAIVKAQKALKKGGHDISELVKRKAELDQYLAGDEGEEEGEAEGEE
jgi:hypothetical protein